MKIDDEVLYYAYSRDSTPIRVGKIIDIVEFKNGILLYIIKPYSGGRILSRRASEIYLLKNIKQLKNDIIQRRK